MSDTKRDAAGAYCAHMKVSYNPEEFYNGTMRERWTCDTSGCEFIPVSYVAVQADAALRLIADNEKLRAANARLEGERNSYLHAAEVGEQLLKVWDPKTRSRAATDASNVVRRQIAAAASKARTPESVSYIVRFDDPDCKDETFTGHGARDAARAFFDDRRTSWNVQLFEMIDPPPESTPEPATDGTEG